MCLILFAYNCHERYSLVLAANRDEFYDRPAAPLGFWPDHPDILAGRDLRAMGTWMGITRQGSYAAITNFRSPLSNKAQPPSRGGLVTGFLEQKQAPDDYLDKLRPQATQYNGFNLITGDMKHLYYFSNQTGSVQPVAPGIHGLSNHLLDTSWPKVDKGRAALTALLFKKMTITPSDLLEMLKDQERACDDQLPDTGVGLQWERLLSPTFITSDTYGTRSSSVLLIDRNGRILFYEQTWRAAQTHPFPDGHKCFEFRIECEIQ